MSVSYAAQVDPAYEISIIKVMNKIENADYEDAVKDLKEVLKSRPDDEKSTLYLGIALSRTNNRDAESYLKKALQLNPGNPRTNLELGIYNYNKSIFDEAEDYFENTVQLAPNTEFSTKAKEYLRFIKQRGITKNWSLNISLGGQYDSNVVLDSGDAPLPEGISRKSDWRGVLYLKGKYAFISSERIDASVGYSFYQSLHIHLSNFNITDNLFDLSATFRISPLLSLKGSYSFDYVLVGGNPYDYAHLLSPSIIISEGKGFSTVVEYRYRNSHFMNTSLFETNSERSGFNNSVGITQNIPLGSFVSLRLGYSFDKDFTRKDYWDYEGNKGMAGLLFSLPANFSIDLYGEYYKKDYEDNNPAISGKTREDKVSTAAISISKILSDRFGVSIGQLYTRNKSNIDAFDYKRAITSLFLNVRF